MKILVPLALAALFAFGAPADHAWQAVPADGAKLYAAHCASCHGDEGRGDGPVAFYVYPRPRDLTSGKFKVRSSTSGTLPLDSDIEGVITRGMPGTSMPGFPFLTDTERKAVLERVKAFAVTPRDGKLVRLWDVSEKPVPIVPGPAPAMSAALIAKGKQMYQALRCAACHGDTGKGNGPLSGTQRDYWGYPVLPNSLARGVYKGGAGDKDLYLRFIAGMDGTAMPSFSGGATEEERWALVAFLKDMAWGRKRSIKEPTEGPIVAAKTAALPPGPGDAAWAAIAPSTISLQLLWTRPESPDTIDVRAVHDGTSIAILLEWDDATMDAGVLGAQDFADGAAVQFPLTPERGSYAMGGKDRPVNLWHWRMDRQADLARRQEVQDAQPRLMSDAPPGEPDPAFLTGRAAGNPHSSASRKSAVEDLNASGLGTLKSQPAAAQNVGGTGSWNSGTWRVMFVRKLESADAGDAALKAGTGVDAAFAVWDGSQRDRASRKCVTLWRRIEIR